MKQYITIVSLSIAYPEDDLDTQIVNSYRKSGAEGGIRTHMFARTPTCKVGTLTSSVTSARFSDLLFRKSLPIAPFLKLLNIWFWDPFNKLHLVLVNI